VLKKIHTIVVWSVLIFTFLPLREKRNQKNMSAQKEKKRKHVRIETMTENTDKMSLKNYPFFNMIFR
jgi:hypothetical protein